MLYCENCSALFETSCPFCRKNRGREPQPEDLCFFTEESALMASIQSDILRQEGIPFVQKVAHGIAPLMGANLTRYRFYTKYQLLDRARECLLEITPEEE